MKCKEIQELIITDYLDHEISEDNRKAVENHISVCPECGEFLALAKKTVIEPLADVKTNDLPQDIIWSKIRQQIQAEKQSVLIRERVVRFWETLKNIIFFPKPRLILSTCAAIAMLILVLNVRHQRIDTGLDDPVRTAALNKVKVIEEQAVESEREEYLSYLLEQDDYYTEYGTSLESFFL